MHDDFYQMYLEELRQIPPCGEEEREKLLALLAGGEASVKKRLIEGHLWQAVDGAKEYAGQGLSLADLVQEASMGLTLAVEEWQGEEFESYLQERIRQAICAALKAQAAQKQAQEEVAARVNVLQLVSQVMAEELGREATVEELANRMKMTPGQVEELMKITLDAVTVSGGGQGG